MKVHRFISNFQLSPGKFIISDPELIHQIWDVLKLRSPEEIILCDGASMEGKARIIDQSDQGIEVQVGQITKNSAEPEHSVALYCAILKKENFEMVCQKATEAGVTEIIPIITDRTIKQGLRMDRLEKIIREAAEQSGRGVLPKLLEAMDFEKALSDSLRFSNRYICDPSGQNFSSKKSTAAIFIGPEGGWSENELSKATQAGLEIASFGPRTLRGETAAIIATFLAAL